MSERKTFMLRALNGEFLDLAEALDDAVDAWHDTSPEPCSLAEWLGFTPTDYKLWAEAPGSLQAIVAAHRYGMDIGALLESYSAPESTALAARGATPKELEEIRAWLKERGWL